MRGTWRDFLCNASFSYRQQGTVKSESFEMAAILVQEAIVISPVSNGDLVLWQEVGFES
jgi:hypothetical protein